MSEELKQLIEDEEEEVLKRIELSPLKNFVFVDYTKKEDGTQR